MARPAAILVVLALLMVAGLVGLATPVAAVATPFPLLKEIRTLGDADTGVSGVEIVFEGAVDARRAHADYFTLTGCTCLNAVIADNSAYDDRFTLRFQSVMPTSITPSVAYDGTIGAAIDFPLRSPENAAGESAAGPDFGPIAAIDRVPPGILDAVTSDRNTNGLIDAYMVSFTESVLDDKFILAQWNVAGTAVGPPVDDGTPNDASLTVPFEERAFLNSGAVPQLTYTLTGGNGLKDPSGNSLQDITTGRVFERDGVPARLLGVVPVKSSTGAYTDAVQAIFSEPVSHRGGGTPVAADFVYTGAGGASAIQTVATTAGSRLVRLTMNAVVTPDDNVGSDDVGTDTLNVAATCSLPASACLQDQAVPTANLVTIGSTVTLLDDAQEPGPVQSLVVTGLGTTTATLTWTSPADFDLDHLEIRMVPQGQNTNWAEMTFVANVTGQPSLLQSFALSGLTAFRSYEVAVRSMDASRNLGPDIVRTTFTTLPAPTSSSSSSSGSGTSSSSSSTNPATTPNAILDLHMSGVSADSAALSWSIPSAGAAISSLQLRYANVQLTEANFLTALAATPPTPGAAGSTQSALLSGLTAQTTYYAGIRGVSSGGVNGPVTFITFTTGNTTGAPSPFLVTSSTHPSGVGRFANNATLQWANATGTGPIVYRMVVASAVRNVTLVDPIATSPVTLTNLAEGTHQVLVAAFGPAGVRQAGSYLVVVDRTAPGALSGVAAAPAAAKVQLAWTLPADAGAGATVMVRRMAGSADAAPAWTLFSNEQALPGTPNVGNFTGLVPLTTYSFALRAADAAGNLGPMAVLRNVTTLPDLTVPTGDLGLAPLPRADGLAIGPVVALSWSTAADLESPILYRYAIVQEDRELGPDDPTTTDPAIVFDDLSEGDWILLVRAESAGGAGPTVRHDVPIRILTASDLRDAEGGIEVRVERRDGANHLTWTLPPLRVSPEGVQVWSSNSPYSLVSTIPVGDTLEFTHEGPEAKASTRYHVTAFYGVDLQQGWFEAPLVPSTNAYPGVAVPTAPLLSGWLLYAVVGGAVLLVAGAAVGAWLWLRNRRATAATAVGSESESDSEANSEETASWQPSDADDTATSAEADAREVACYQCTTVYTAAGALPLETVCPSCGARGMLGA